MPVARYQLPDGRVARFDVPNGTTPEQAQQIGTDFFAQQQAPVAPAAVPGAELLSPKSRQLAPEQQQQLVEARQAQAQAVGAPEIAQQPTAASQEKISLEQLRATAPKSALFARDLPEISEAPELQSVDLSALRPAIASFLITDESELAGAFQELIPGTEVQQDPEGNPLVKLPSGGTFAINKPGFSRQDFDQFAARLLAFTPASRIIGTGAKQLAKGAGAASGTEAALQTAETGVGGEFDPEQAVAAGVISPIGQVVGEKVIQPAIQGAIKSFKEIGSTKLLGEAAPSIETLKGSARAIYNEIDNAGAIIKPNIYKSLVKKVSTQMERNGLDPNLSKDANNLLKTLRGELGGDINLTKLDTLRKISKSVASSDNDLDAALGRIAVDQIDDLMVRLGPGAFRGGEAVKIQGKTAGEAFSDARNFWGRAKRAEEIEQAIDLASNSASGFENGLRQNFRALTKKIKKGQLRGFSKEELFAIEQVEQGTSFGNIVKQLGKLGIPEDQASNTLILTLIGGAGVAGGVTGGTAAAAIAIPTVLRRVARQLTESNAKIASAVTRSKGNALEIAKSYMRNVPKNERDTAELAGLLLNGGAIFPDKETGNLLIDNAIFAARAAAQAETTETE